MNNVKMVQGESPKEQKELLIKARLITQMVEEERSWIFGSGNLLWEGRLITIEWTGVGQEGETVYALNDPKYVFVCLLGLPDFLGQQIDQHLSLDSIKGDTIEFIVAKCEVEILYRQWRSPIIYVSHQDSLAYTE
jgi:hypothetical protein